MVRSFGTVLALAAVMLAGCAGESDFSFEQAARKFANGPVEKLAANGTSPEEVAAVQDEPPVAEKSLIVSNDELDTAIGPEDVDVPQYVAALDANTGMIRWKRSRESDHSYSTPLVITHSGLPQVVSVGGRGAAAYEPATGRELWWMRHDGCSVVPRPVYGNGLVYLCTGYTTPLLLAMDPSGENDVTDTHLRWEAERGVPCNPSPVLIGKRLFLLTDTGVLSCYGADSGELSWQKRLRGHFSASPVHAEGRLYLTDDDGTTHVVDVSDTPRVVATNELDGQVQASVAVTGRSLVIRTDTHLYRIENRQDDGDEPIDNENDWPQFRGPDGQGRSANTRLPVEWSESENIVWRTVIPGRGWSSPVVAGNQIWMTTAVLETEDPMGPISLQAICVDRQTGRIIRQVEVIRKASGGKIHARSSHASPTPVVDGDRVFVHFGAHGTACLATDGELVWRTRLKYHHHHGPAGSPIVVNGLMIVNCDGYDVPYDPEAAKARGETDPEDMPVGDDVEDLK